MNFQTINWAQNDILIRIRIEVKDTLKPILSFDEKFLKLVPENFSIDDQNSLFKLEFFDLVVPDKSYFRIGINEIFYEISKAKPKYWPRLIKSIDYHPFLQEETFISENYNNLNDFDSDENNQNFFKTMQNSHRLVRSNRNFGRRKKQNITHDEFQKVWLFLYNLFQFVGFNYILVVLSIRYAKEGADSTHGSYKALGFVIKLLYLTQLMEIFHTVFLKTSRSTFFLILQLIFRYFIIFIMIDSEPRIQEKHIVFYLLLVYTSIELIKYPYYMLRLFHVNISFLTWIRCTINFFLYPIACVCEGIIMFKNLAYFEETQRYSLYLPNQLNFSFSLPNFIRCYLLLGLFPFLYLTIARLYYYRLNMLTKKNHHFFKTD